MTIIDDWKALHKFDKYATVIFALVLLIASPEKIVAWAVIIPLVIALYVFIILGRITIKVPFLRITQAMALCLLFIPIFIFWGWLFHIGQSVFTLTILAGVMVILAFIPTKVAGRFEMKIEDYRAKIERWKSKRYDDSDLAVMLK